MKNSIKQKSGGFTLMEMLIVVAIIAVLVAIAIPTFASSLEKSRTAACLANRRALYAEATLQYMSDNVTHPTELTAEEAKTYVCPSGGKITVLFDEITKTFNVNCSKHGLLFGEYSSPADAFKKAIENLTANGTQIFNSNRDRVDSTTTIDDSMAQQVKDELANMGVDIDALGAKTWAIINSSAAGANKGTNIIWSSYSIVDSNGTKAYSSVPAICRKPDGSYVVGMTNVNTRTIDGKTYYVIAQSAEKNGFNPGGGQSFTSLEDATNYYNTLSPKS